MEFSKLSGDSYKLFPTVMGITSNRNWHYKSATVVGVIFFKKLSLTLLWRRSLSYINQYIDLLLYPLNTLESQRFSDVFRGYRMKAMD